MIKYSNMLKEVLKLYPKEISCADAKPIGKEGMHWESLHNIYDNIEEENNYFEDTNELLGGLLWSVLVGINEGFRKEFVEENKSCKSISPKKIIDLDETKEHFIETIEDEYWQNYLKEINEEIVFDDVSKANLTDI